MKHCHTGFFFQAMSSHIRGSFCLFYEFSQPSFWLRPLLPMLPPPAALLLLLLLLAGSKPPLSHAEIHFYEYKEFRNVQKNSVFQLETKKWWTWSTFFKYQSWILKRSLNIALTKIKEESVSHFGSRKPKLSIFTTQVKSEHQFWRNTNWKTHSYKFLQLKNPPPVVCSSDFESECGKK